MTSNIVIRVLLAFIAMLLGFLLFWNAHRIDASKPCSPQQKENAGPSTKGYVYNKRICRYWYIFGCFCLLDGVLFAYIPTIAVSSILAIVLFLVGALLVLYGYYTSNHHMQR